MVRIQGSTVIARPVEEVFDFVADERNETQYNPHLLRVEKVTPGPIDCGTRWQATIGSRGRALDMDTEVTEYARPTRLGSRTSMRAAEIHGTVTFEPEGAGTRLGWDWELRPRGLARLATPAISRLGQRQEEQVWAGLKRRLEDGTGTTATAPPAVRPPDTHVTTLADGRALAWLEVGDPGGAPVLAFHGTPGSRLQLVSADTDARAAGARLVVPDRPGYGLSTYQPRRSFASWADDVAQLADHLGVKEFAVVGVSGGGPHAAACGRYLPDRVTVAAIVSGVAELSEPGSEAGMLAGDALLTRLARRVPVSPRPLTAALTRLERHRPERFVDILADQLGPADAALLERPDVRAAFVADMRGSSRTTGAALAQECALFARAWGFSLTDVTVPVHLWHGDADREVPIAHARRQAALIPNAVLHECPGEGHLLVADRMQEILRTVTA